MSTSIVNTIVTNIKSIIESEIGSTFTNLPYEFNILKNNLKTTKKGYSVVPKELSSESGVIRSLTVDQNFEITLIDSFVNHGNDSKQTTALYNLYDKIYTIYTKLFLSKIGLGSTVMNINNLSIEAPEFLEEENIIILKSSLRVIYRQAII